MEDYASARTAYLHSLAIRDQLGQPSLSMEPISGLVEAALGMDDLQTASFEAQKILAYFDGGGALEGVEEPLRVYHVCYKFLNNIRDPHAKEILQEANRLLESQVSKFSDPLSRKLYVENFPWRQAIFSAAREH
jgi:hypothetical protein